MFTRDTHFFEIFHQREKNKHTVYIVLFQFLNYHVVLSNLA